MKNLCNGYVTLFIIISIFTLSSPLYSQPKEMTRMGMQKKMGRLMELKKVQLLETLDLNQEQSEKFLSKYNADMKKIIELNADVQEANLELRKSIAANENEDNVKSKTQKLENSQKILHEASIKRLTSMKEILTAEQYAKFLVFEKSFADEVSKHKERIRDRIRGRK